MNLVEILTETLQITFLIFFMMIAVELLELKFSQFIRKYFSEENSLKYIVSSFMGLLPGCAGTFIMDSFYMAGIVGFGSIVATMVATIGDEAFYLLSLAIRPENSLSLSFVFSLFGLLFVAGIVGGLVADKIVRLFGITVSEKCLIELHNGFDTQSIHWKHFFTVHTWRHIFKKHVLKIFIWILGSIIIISLLQNAFNIEKYLTDRTIIVLLLAGLIGIVPLSGPNIILITLFAEGIIPFSVIITNSIVQDGHGLLPLLGFSVNDSIKIKIFNLLYGCGIGLILLSFGW